MRLAVATMEDGRATVSVVAEVLREVVANIARLVGSSPRHVVWFRALPGAVELSCTTNPLLVVLRIPAVVPPEVAKEWVPFSMELWRVRRWLAACHPKERVSLSIVTPAQRVGRRIWPRLLRVLRAHPTRAVALYAVPRGGVVETHLQVVEDFETAIPVIRAACRLCPEVRDFGVGVAWVDEGQAHLLLDAGAERVHFAAAVNFDGDPVVRRLPSARPHGKPWPPASG